LAAFRRRADDGIGREAAQAFERGALDDADDELRTRLANLKEQARLLRGRRAQIRAELEQPPEAPTPVPLDAVVRRIREVITNGEIKMKKALFEVLIDRFEIHSDAVEVVVLVTHGHGGGCVRREDEREAVPFGRGHAVCFV